MGFWVPRPLVLEEVIDREKDIAVTECDTVNYSNKIHETSDQMKLKSIQTSR